MTRVPGQQLADVEVVEDRADQYGPRDGFLKLQRLIVRNRYRDGTSSEAYPCDIVSRTGVDAVTVLLFERRAQGAVLVGLRENLRVPVFLRQHSASVPFPDEPPHCTLLETVAGILEPHDGGGRGGDVDRALVERVCAECLEEVGLEVEADQVLDLGGASFPSPGITDEKVYFKAAEIDFSLASDAYGDGSVMEEVGGLLVLDLKDALQRCRDGRIADMKTEIALRRLEELLDS